MSDSGPEYAFIKFNDEKLFSHFQVVVSEGRHTLARVDRVIRTIRGLIREYYSNAEKGNWKAMLIHLLNLYNNTKHDALFLRDPKILLEKYHTPEQAWQNPELSRRIKIKEYLEK